MADAADSKSAGVRPRVGSSPTSGTFFIFWPFTLNGQSLGAVHVRYILYFLCFTALTACHTPTLSSPASQPGLLRAATLQTRHLETLQAIVKEAYTRNFHTYDTNQDQSLSLEEYIPSFQKLPVPIPNTKIEAIFQQRDTNRNGKLEEIEFVGNAEEHHEIAQRLQVSARKLFTSIDLNKDMRVTRDEVALMGIAEALTHFDRFVRTSETPAYLQPEDFENLMAYVILIAGYSH